MKTSIKLIIGSVLIVLVYFVIQFATNKTGNATDEATVQLSITSSNVTPEPTPTPTPSPETGAGGAGGGGAGGVPACKESWECLEWGECSPAEYQTRTCIDNRRCGTIRNKPSEIQRCNYVTRPANCFDNIKNSNEEGVDCGGNCVSCPSCNDGIKNQDETDIDCGSNCRECFIQAGVSEKRAFGIGIFGLEDLIKEINVFWPAWLLLSILLLIFVQLYHALRENL